MKRSCFILSVVATTILASSCSLDRCVNFEKQCVVVDGMIHSQMCENGEWNEPVRCKFNACTSANECSECAIDSIDCTGNVARICKDGKWQDAIDSDVCKAPEGTCNDGDFRCKYSMFYLCSDGQWNHGTPCANGASCKSETECDNPEDKCDIGATRCLDDGISTAQYQTCTTGTWDSLKTCPTGACDVFGRKCIPCSDNKTYCENDDAGEGKLKKCANGRLDAGEPCPQASCKSSEACGECINGETRCNDNNDIGVMETCKNGTWIEMETCPNDTSCKNKTTCGDCTNGAIKCADEGDIGYYETCQKGLWKDKTNCPNNLKCADETACIACTDGETRCLNQGNIGQFSTCKNGKWDTAKACHDDVSCKSTTECGECKDGARLECDDVLKNNIAFKTCENGTTPDKPKEYCIAERLSCNTMIPCTIIKPQVRKITYTDAPLAVFPNNEVGGDESIITYLGQDDEVIVYEDSPFNEWTMYLIKLGFPENEYGWFVADNSGRPSISAQTTKYTTLISSLETYEKKCNKPYKVIPNEVHPRHTLYQDVKEPTDYVLKEGDTIHVCGEPKDGYYKFIYKHQIVWISKDDITAAE